MKITRMNLPLFLFLLFFLNFNFFSPPLALPEGISSALKTGNSKALSGYFNNNIELVILGNQDVYSKAQAELIVKDFFRKYPPKEFSILNEGGRNTSRYAIGNLYTKRGTFRVYLLLKIVRNKHYIHQLRIEKENG